MPTTPAIDCRLLDVLLTAGDALSTDTLAARLNLSPRALSSELARLATAGCDLELHPSHGIRLLRTGLPTWQDYLQWKCPLPGNIARLLEIYRRTTSTQDACRRLLAATGPWADGAVILADEQTAGRGRLGRAWVAPPGRCVLMSRLVAPGGPPLSADHLAFASAVAVARAVEEGTAPAPLPVGIKWPNDLLVSGRKLAGILVETVATPEGDAAILGIGLNVDLLPADIPADHPDLAARLTSLRDQGHAVDRLRVAAAVIAHLDLALAATDLTPLLDQWRQRSTLLGQDVHLRHNGREFRGHVVDLDPRDGLIVRTDAGDLVHLPAATATIL